VVEAGHDPRRFAEDLLERLRDLIVLNAVPDAGEKGLLDEPADVIERMSRQSAQLGRVELTRAADIVNTGLTEMRGATAPRLLLELICARVLLPAVGDDEASLLVRLERLERRFAIAGDAATAAAPVVSRPAPAASVAETRPPATAPAPTDGVAARTTRPTVSAGPTPSDAAPTDIVPADGEAPDVAPSAPSARPVDVAAGSPVAVPPLATGDLDAAAVRRIWDDVLEVAKRLKRRTHALLLSGPAQVVDVRANVLVVGFASGPVERQFNTGDNVDILRVALKEVLGVDWRIETTLSGPAATAAASGDDGPSVVKPAAPLPTPSESMAADRAPSRSAAARAAANEPKEPRVRRAAEPEPPVAIVLDEPNPDDDDADDGTSGLALLQRHLGATVIDDGETS
jgi:DNA polymerase-3 subunit gamma/tau